MISYHEVKQSKPWQDTVAVNATRKCKWWTSPSLNQCPLTQKSAFHGYPMSSSMFYIIYIQRFQDLEGLSDKLEVQDSHCMLRSKGNGLNFVEAGHSYRSITAQAFPQFLIFQLHSV